MERTPLAKRIEERLKSLGLSAREASTRATGSPYTIQNILDGKSQSPRTDTLKKLAEVLQTSVDWLASGESDRQGAQSEIRVAETNVPQPDGPRTVPVLGTAAGALIPDNGGNDAFEGFEIDSHPIEYVRQPAALAGQTGLYAIYVVGDSMEPRHGRGEKRLVQTHRPPQPGDTVIVQTKHWEHDPGQAYIKVYRRRAGGCVVLEQLNPVATLQIPEQYVIAMHRVVPYEELI